MERVRPILQGFAQTNVAMQAFFRKWADHERDADAAGSLLDYTGIPFLAEVNRNLLRDCDDEALFEQPSRNLELARKLRRKIMAEAGRAATAPTCHLTETFVAI